MIVDGDSQCNLTALILGDEFDAYYTDNNTRYSNVKDALSVAFEGKPSPIQAVDCYVAKKNANLFLIPGHMDLAAYEQPLSFAMTSPTSLTTLQNLPGALAELIRLCVDKYGIDYVFIDINPGLSAFNQMSFIISDAFIVPTNPDPFSLMALRTLATVLPRWKSWADNSRRFFESASYPLPDTGMKFIGELCQRFNRRKGAPTATFAKTIDEIKSYINGDFANILAKSCMAYERDNFHLPEIPDFGSMIQRANDLGVPVFALQDKEIPGGAVSDNMTAKRDELFTLFSHIADIIVEVVV